MMFRNKLHGENIIDTGIASILTINELIAKASVLGLSFIFSFMFFVLVAEAVYVFLTFLFLGIL